MTHLKHWMIQHNLAPGDLAPVMPGATEVARYQRAYRMVSGRSTPRVPQINAMLRRFAQLLHRPVTYEEIFRPHRVENRCNQSNADLPDMQGPAV